MGVFKWAFVAVADCKSRVSLLAHFRDKGAGIMYHIIFRECGNLIRDATPYASYDEAHEEAEIMIEMKMEVIEIVYTA